MGLPGVPQTTIFMTFVSTFTPSLYLTNSDATLKFKAETELMLTNPISFPWTMEDISQAPLPFGWDLMGCG